MEHNQKTVDIEDEAEAEAIAAEEEPNIEEPE